LTALRRIGIVSTGLFFEKGGRKMACKSGSKASPCGSKKTAAKKKKK
jgi:hypothetical protein